MCRSRRSLYHEAIRHPQVYRDDIAVQDRLFGFLVGQVMERSADVAFRQTDDDAVGQVKVPAASSYPGGGVDALEQRRNGAEMAEQFLRMLGRVGADDLEQVVVAAQFALGQDLAVAVDQGQLAVALPQRHRAALVQLDEDGVGQASLDRGVGDPAQPFQAGAGGFRIELHDRVAALDLYRGHHGVAVSLVAAFD